jgi:hypothetical protein
MSESFSCSRMSQHLMEPTAHQCILISCHTVNIMSCSGNIPTDYCPFLTLDLEDKFHVNIYLPPCDQDFKSNTFIAVKLNVVFLSHLLVIYTSQIFLWNTQLCKNIFLMGFKSVTTVTVQPGNWKDYFYNLLSCRPVEFPSITSGFKWALQ